MQAPRSQEGPFDIRDRVAVVVGVDGPAGVAAARALAGAGARTVVAGDDEPALHALAMGMGANGIAKPCHTGSSAGVQALFEEIGWMGAPEIAVVAPPACEVRGVVGLVASALAPGGTLILVGPRDATVAALATRDDGARVNAVILDEQARGDPGGAVVFLASDAAKDVRGAVIPLR